MKPKKKQCKGINKANQFTGCGEMVYRHRYGLCKSCYNKFLLTTSEGAEIINKAKIKARKETKKQIDSKVKEMAKKLKNHSYYLKKLQYEFNKFIRLRDRDKPCITCGAKTEWKKANASHFYAVGKVPQLRFNEDNVHSSCVKCNKWLHGNLENYAERLPKRIGQKRFNKLQESKNKDLKLSIPELKEKIQHYRNLNKEMTSKL